MNLRKIAMIYILSYLVRTNRLLWTVVWCTKSSFSDITFKLENIQNETHKTWFSALSYAMNKVYIQQKQTEGVDPHKQTHAHIYVRSNSKWNKA